MAGESRTINAIVVPIKSDVGGFGKGLDKARKDADKFHKDTDRSFSLMGKGISDSLAKGTDKLKALGQTNLGMLTKGMAGLAAAAIASAGAIGLIGFKHIGDLGKDALSLGVGVETLSKLRNVAKGAGTDVKDLDEFLGGLSGTINEAIGRSDGAAEAFKLLGTSAEQLQKLTPEEQIKKLNAGFAALPDDAERSRVAMRLMGQTGVKVMATLGMKVDEFNKKFADAPSVTEEQVSDIKKLQSAIDRISIAVTDLAALFTSKVAPAIESVADLLAGVASKFGVAVKAMAKPIAVPTLPKADVAPSSDKDQIRVQLAARAQSERQAEADKARLEAAKLQERFDKQSSQLARTKPSYVPSTNGGAMRLAPKIQKQLDAHGQTGSDLNAAKSRANSLADAAKSQAGAMTDAMRMNAQLMKDVGALKQEYRQTIEGSGKDEIHRRVDQLKGLSTVDRKALIRQGYQAREAAKTSSLRDELQESTKLPIEKLGEELSRIDKMVALGAANGGLTKAQGLRAAAQKTQEAGLAGGQVQFAGALQSNSMEGRSYLLSQTVGKPESMLETAKKGLDAALQGNGFLGQIVNRLDRNGQEIIANM